MFNLLNIKKIKSVEFLFIFLVLFSAFSWRFINYSERWTLSQDQARDAIIGLEAIKERSLPLMGPPSSAGAFSFGPTYYWLIILFTLLTPNLVFGPWIGFTLLSFTSVLLFYMIGKSLGGKYLALILGLIASFTSSDVFNAPDMLNPMPIGFLTTLSFISAIYLIEKQKIFYSLILGLSVGLAINFHLQALGLLTFFPLCIFLNNFNFKQKLKVVFGLICGLITAFAPLIYFDFNNKGVWINSIFQYLTVGQNKFNNSLSLINEIATFWPNFSGEIIFNNQSLGYLIIVIFIVSLMLVLRQKPIAKKSVQIILISLLLQIVALHFYKGPRMPVYLISFHPYFIFFLGFSVWEIWKFQRILAVFLLLFILTWQSISNYQIINTGSQVQKVLKIKAELKSKIKPPYDIYSYPSSFNISLPLFYLLQKEGKISENGVKIGVCDHYINRSENLTDYDENCPSNENIIISEENLRIYDLKNASNLFKITPEKIYSWIYDNYKN